MTDDVRESDHDVDNSASGAEPQVVGDELAAAICARFEGAVFYESHGQPVVYVDKAVFADVATLLRDEEQVTMCLDVTAVDHLADSTRHCAPGVRPERFQIVVAKGVQSPRPAYTPIAAEIILVNTPGVTTADLSTFTYHRRRRPLYPFEPDAAYDADH